MDAHLLRQQQQMNSGLLRYRSAPSSLFANFMDGDDDFITAAAVAATNNRPSSPEAESMFARFMGSCDSNSQSLHEIGEKSVAVKAEERSGNHFMGGIDGGEQIMYHSHSQPPLPPQAMLNHNGSNVGDTVYKVQNNMELDQQSSSPMKMATGGGNVSNLIRHSSSPAGLFANLHVENGYAVMRGMNFGAGSSPNGETTASGSRLKNQVNFPSGPPCSSGMMSPISESGGESMGPGTTNGGSLSSSNVNNQYASNFPMNSWDDSAMENFANAKRFRDSNAKMSSDLNSPESQNQDGMNQTRNLTHHFSLPKNSAEMAAILQFQDSVPCKIRAKRGCATHPRSIAERVRRTRISERMRKLQELVPNMDKQTNTADMLDLAVEYIKELQTEVKKLNDCRANCTCSSSQKPY